MWLTSHVSRAAQAHFDSTASGTPMGISYRVTPVSGTCTHMKYSNLLLGGGIACLAALSMPACGGSAPADELTVRRINVVDASGKVRLVIAGDLPGPMVRGERLKRDIEPAGVIWHDEDANESGGIAVTAVSGWKGAAQSGQVRMLTFDYTHQITDAVRFGTYETDDGTTWHGGLTVFDRRPYDAGPVTSSQGIERISLGTENGDASLVIRDAGEKERIRIGVDREGNAVIELLGDDGSVLQRLPHK